MEVQSNTVFPETVLRPGGVGFQASNAISRKSNINSGDVRVMPEPRNLYLNNSSPVVENYNSNQLIYEANGLPPPWSSQIVNHGSPPQLPVLETGVAEGPGLMPWFSSGQLNNPNFVSPHSLVQGDLGSSSTISSPEEREVPFRMPFDVGELQVFEPVSWGII